MQPDHVTSSQHFDGTVHWPAGWRGLLGVGGWCRGLFGLPRQPGPCGRATRKWRIESDYFAVVKSVTHPRKTDSQRRTLALGTAGACCGRSNAGGETHVVESRQSAAVGIERDVAFS